MPQIQRVSRYLLIALNLLLFAIPCFVIAQGFMEKDQMIDTPEGFVNVRTLTWAAGTKAIWLAGLAVNMVPIFLSLFVLKTLFRNYQIGEIFTKNNANQYRKLGLLFFIYALVAEPISNLLTILAVTLTNPPGHRYIQLALGTPNLEALFCGILVLVISWIMREATKMHDEQSLTV